MTSDQEMQELADGANDDIGIQYSLSADEWLLTCDKPTMQMLRHSCEWVPDALARLDQIRELHKPGRVNIPDWKGLYCILCREPYPCPTVRILEGN